MRRFKDFAQKVNIKKAKRRIIKGESTKKLYCCDFVTALFFLDLIGRAAFTTA